MVRCLLSRRGGRVSGFSLIELLVVIGIIGLLISAMLPALCASKERANRVKCASNLRQIGQGLMLYANDNKGAYPRTRAVECGPVGKGFTGAEAFDPFKSDGPEVNDPTAALFLLIRQADLNPEVFNCPSSNQDKDSLNNLPATSRSNFSLQNNLSYSVANMYAKYGGGQEGNGAKPGGEEKETKAKYGWGSWTSADFAIMADRNQSENRGKNLNPNAPTSDLKAMNTVNHEKEGQNVMFNDGHVEWFTTPFCGANRDQIYTAAGKGDNTKRPGGVLDTVLVPMWTANGVAE